MAESERISFNRAQNNGWLSNHSSMTRQRAGRFLIPAAQILGAGKVVAGLADVVEAIGDPELARAFLSQE